MEKSKSWIWIISIVAAIFVLSWIVILNNNSIVGTWTVSAVEIDGERYSYSEYQQEFNDYHTIEYHFRKNGSLTAVADDISVEGTWYKSSKDTYGIAAAGENWWLTLKGGNSTILTNLRLLSSFPENR